MVRCISKAGAESQIDVQSECLEIDNAKDGVLLLVRWRNGIDRAVARIVFDAEPRIAADVVGQPCGRGECRGAIGREAQVDDWIYDEFPALIAHAEDWPYLETYCALRELRCLVAQFEIDAVKELPLLGMGRHEKVSKLEARGQESAVGSKGEGQVEADFRTSPSLRMRIPAYR